MNHALYTKLGKITTAASLAGLEVQNQACSAISGVPLNLEEYAEGKALEARAVKVRRRLDAHFAPKTNPETFDGQGRSVPQKGAAPVDVALCACERYRNTGRSGFEFIDRVLEAMPDRPRGDQAIKLKRMVENCCEAAIHYPTEVDDTNYGGRPVHASTDEEKAIENAEALAEQMWLDCNPHARFKTFEAKGDTARADFNGEQSSDQLDHQRKVASDRAEEKIRKEDATTMQMDFDGKAAQDYAERQILKRMRAEEKEPQKATAWEKAVWDNKRRIRGVNEQARRDLWAIIRKYDADAQQIQVGWIKDRVAELRKVGNFHPYIQILSEVRTARKVKVVMY